MDETTEPSEIRQISYLFQLLKVLAPLLRVVHTSYGWLYDDEAAEIYREIRSELDFVCSTILDEELIGETPAIEYGLPDELYAKKRWSDNSIENGVELPPQEWYDGILDAIDDVEKLAKLAFDRIDRKIVPLTNEIRSLMANAKGVTARLQKNREEVISQWGSEITAVTQSTELSSLIRDLEFQFVTNTRLRTALERYTTEAVDAYRNELYLSSIIQTRAAIETLLVWVLELNEADAKLDYLAIWTKRRTNQTKLPEIDRWEFPVLIEVAKKHRILRTENFERYAIRINSSRNMLHPSKFSDREVPTANDAALAIICLCWLTRDVKEYVQA